MRQQAAAAEACVAVASGKGGTGKTFIATNLAWLVANEGQAVTYVDADVEAPNGHLFLRDEAIAATSTFSVGVPSLRGGRCSGCGQCQSACAFNALLSLKDRVMVFNELCHDCGACQLICPEGLLGREERPIGTLQRYDAGGIRCWGGTLNIGEAKAPPLIEGLLETVTHEADPGANRGKKPGAVIIDAPPGTSCATMASLSPAKRVLLVTEPTPFGLHDLSLAIKLCRKMGKPVAAVINRADIGDRAATIALLEKYGVELLTEIPFSATVARLYAEGKLPLREIPALRKDFEPIAAWLAAGSPT